MSVILFLFTCLFYFWVRVLFLLRCNFSFFFPFRNAEETKMNSGNLNDALSSRPSRAFIVTLKRGCRILKEEAASQFYFFHSESLNCPATGKDFRELGAELF